MEKMVGYGQRWLVEIVFSAFKRMLGDYVYSRKWENVIQELKIKADVYNRMVELAMAQ